MHPFGEVMEILAIPVPLFVTVEGFAETAFQLRFANAQTTCRRVLYGHGALKPADPALACVIVVILAQHSVDLLDQRQGLLRARRVACALEQCQEIADRKGVGPQIAVRLFIAVQQTCSLGKV